jgi:HSP20 family protein
MALMTWDPIGEMAAFRQQMDRLIESFFGRRLYTMPPATPTEGWAPDIDVSETKEEIQVKMDAPGMEQKDITISLSGDNLIVRGERKSEKEEKEKHFLRVERNRGAFQKVISLPVSVDADKITAEMDKGVLSVHLPKKVEAKLKQIPIAVK